MELVFQIFLYLIITTGIFLAWYLFLDKFNFSNLDRYLASFVFLLAQLVLTQLVLGILGSLTLELVLLVNILISVLVVRGNLKKPEFNLKGLLKSPHVFLIIPVLVFLLFQAVLAYLSQDISYDSLIYHHPWVVYVIQSGSIQLFETSVPWVNFYPKVIESWYLWQLLMVRSINLLDVANFSFWLVGIGGLYSLARKLSYSPIASWLASLSLAVIPVYVLQLRTGYIDLALVSLIVLLLNFSLIKNVKKSYLVWFLTAGILVGAKASMIPIVFLIFIYWLLRQDSKDILKYLPRGILIVFTLGSFYYLRNLIIFGNPFYPIKMLGFPGAIDIPQLTDSLKASVLVKLGPLQTALYNLTHFKPPYTYNMNPGGFGILYVLLLLPATLIYIVRYIKDKPKIQIILLFIFMYAVTPSNWDLRYVSFFAILGCLAVADLYDNLKTGHLALLLFWITLGILNLVYAQDLFEAFTVEERFPQYVEYFDSGVYDENLQVILPLWEDDLGNVPEFRK